MHKQTLKNLLQYHRDVQFKQFCSEIFPDFRLSESYGYLSGKFSLFQYRFMQFLSELDEAHLENFSDAILKRYGSDEPEFCDIMDSMQELIARKRRTNLPEDQRQLLRLQAQALLVEEVYPFETQLKADEREMELAALRSLLEELKAFAEGILMIDLDLTPYNLIILLTSGGTINHILFLYWNHQISREQTLEYLADIPSDIPAEWIDDLVNRVNEAMSFATLANRLDYPDGRPLPAGEIHERILEAAKRFCFKGSIKNWTAGMTMKARDEGLIEDYEYWTAERIANDMAEKAQAGKRKLY